MQYLAFVESEWTKGPYPASFKAQLPYGLGTVGYGQPMYSQYYQGPTSNGSKFTGYGYPELGIYGGNDAYGNTWYRSSGTSSVNPPPSEEPVVSTVRPTSSGCRTCRTALAPSPPSGATGGGGGGGTTSEKPLLGKIGPLELPQYGPAKLCWPCITFWLMITYLAVSGRRG